MLATPITDLVFADDAVIFAVAGGSSDESRNTARGAKPLGLQVSWPKTKIQVFGGLVGETIQSIHACGEDIDILDNFKYLDSVVHNNESR